MGAWANGKLVDIYIIPKVMEEKKEERRRIQKGSILKMLKSNRMQEIIALLLWITIL